MKLPRQLVLLMAVVLMTCVLLLALLHSIHRGPSGHISVIIQGIRFLDHPNHPDSYIGWHLLRGEPRRVPGGSHVPAARAPQP